jgi:ribonuclease HI
MLTARFDGGCVKNPGGHAACACVIQHGAAEVYRHSRYLGFGPEQSNNVAEFHGIKAILEWYIAAKTKQPILIRGDSQIVIFRMQGRYPKPAAGLCARVARECIELRNQIPENQISFQWQRRAHNDVCDSMCDLLIEAAMSSATMLAADVEVRA